MQNILTTKVDSHGICAVIFIYRENEVLFGFRHYPERSTWTVPGGKCEIGETIEQCIQREVQEETGITGFTIKKYFGIVSGARDAKNNVHMFSGTTDQEPVVTEPDKFSEWKWFDRENIPDNFISHRELELFLNEKNNFIKIKNNL